MAQKKLIEWIAAAQKNVFGLMRPQETDNLLQNRLLRKRRLISAEGADRVMLLSLGVGEIGGQRSPWVSRGSRCARIEY